MKYLKVISKSILLTQKTEEKIVGRREIFGVFEYLLNQNPTVLIFSHHIKGY